MPATLDVAHLRTFLTVAETGSFGRAARAADHTQAAVSLQMQLLERRVGKSVFVRDGGGSHLTEVGWRLIPYARQMVYLSEEAASAFADNHTATSVTFAIPDDYAEPFLPDILKLFSRTSPKVDVSVVCATSNKIVEMAWSGEIDLGLVTNHCPAEVETVGEDQLVWASSENGGAERQDVLPLAVAGPDCPWRKHALETLTAAGRRYRIAFVSTNAGAIAAVVLTGFAVTLLSKVTLRRGMRTLGGDQGMPPLSKSQIGLVRPWNRIASREARALADTVRAVIARPRRASDANRSTRRSDNWSDGRLPSAAAEI